MTCCGWRPSRRGSKREWCALGDDWAVKLRQHSRRFLSCDEASTPIIAGEVGGSEDMDVVGCIGGKDNTDSDSSMSSNAAMDSDDSIFVSVGDSC